MIAFPFSVCMSVAARAVPQMAFLIVGSMCSRCASTHCSAHPLRHMCITRLQHYIFQYGAFLICENGRVCVVCVEIDALRKSTNLLSYIHNDSPYCVRTATPFSWALFLFAILSFRIPGNSVWSQFQCAAIVPRHSPAQRTPVWQCVCACTWHHHLRFARRLFFLSSQQIWFVNVPSHDVPVA